MSRTYRRKGSEVACGADFAKIKKVYCGYGAFTYHIRSEAEISKLKAEFSMISLYSKFNGSTHASSTTESGLGFADSVIRTFVSTIRGIAGIIEKLTFFFA